MELWAGMACYQHGLCSAFPRLFESLDCLFGTRGQIFSAAYRALLIVLSYSFLYAQLLTFLALDDFKSFIAIVSLLLLFLA